MYMWNVRTGLLQQVNSYKSSTTVVVFHYSGWAPITTLDHPTSLMTQCSKAGYINIQVDFELHHSALRLSDSNSKNCRGMGTFVYLVYIAVGSFAMIARPFFFSRELAPSPPHLPFPKIKSTCSGNLLKVCVKCENWTTTTGELLQVQYYSSGFFTIVGDLQLQHMIILHL